jgi:hypothetical protein
VNIFDRAVSSLVLKRGGLVAVDTSRVRFGTGDEAIAADGLTRSGFTSPFEVTGVTTSEEGVGALAQEDWEGAWQQWVTVLVAPVLLVIFVACAALLSHLAAGPIAFGLLAVFPFCLRWLMAWQTAQSEVTSHAISARACQKYQAMSEERSLQCFADNLGGYDQYPALRKLAAARLRALVVAEYPYADRWLARADVQQRCQTWLASANAEPAAGR